MLIENSPRQHARDHAGVETALDALRLGYPGLSRPADLPSGDVHRDGFENLGIAYSRGVLVVLVLGAFMASWRTALICLIAIPLSLLTAAVVLSLRGATLNTMVLAGFVIAVGSSSTMHHRRRAHRAEAAAAPVGRQRSVDGLDHMGRDARGEPTRSLRDADRPARGRSVFFMRACRAFFTPLAVSYILAVVASVVVALTSPRAGLDAPGGAPIKDARPRSSGGCSTAMNRLLARTIHAPRAAAVSAVVLVAVGLAVWPLLAQSFLPAFKERNLVIDWVGAPGTSHPAMSRVMNHAARELRAVPGVTNVSAHLGVP